jgi:hypothetical protein
MKTQSLICAILLTFVFVPLAVGQGTTKSKGAQTGEPPPTGPLLIPITF